MTDQQELRGSNLEKDPAEWKTGDQPMTGAQASYLKTLSDQANEAFDENLTKAEASRRTDELQERTGRGRSWATPGPGSGQARAGSEARARTWVQGSGPGQDLGQATARSATPVRASTTPAFWPPDSRSPSSQRARKTVATGYSDPSTPTTARLPPMAA
jgi:Protein of unknown function (DUF3072)